MIEEYRQWGVRARRLDGPGELTLPARDEEDARYTQELMRPSDRKIIEVVSHAVGPWETDEERETNRLRQEHDVLVHLPEVLIFENGRIYEVRSYGAHRTVSGSLDALERAGFFRPDVRLIASPRSSTIDAVHAHALSSVKNTGERSALPYYVVSTKDLTSEKMHGVYGFAVIIRVEVLQP
jgi:hypothetical protein